MNFNLGEWFVKALELFKESVTLRRMYYAAVFVFAMYGVAALVKAFK